MSKLSVSGKRVEKLRLISELSDETVKELFAVMASRPAALYQTSLASDVATEVKSLASGEVVSVVDTLLSMYQGIIDANKSVTEFAGELALSVRTEPGWDAESANRLQANLERLLRVPSTSLGAKATSLIFQNERSLITNKIFTDARPVFELEGDEIGGGVIVHTLKLEYFVDGADEKQTFYVSLDASDIEQLIDNLERAKRKGEKLRTLLTAAALPVICEAEK